MTATARVHWSVGLTRQMPDRTDRAAMIEQRLARYFDEVAGTETAVEIGWQAYTTSNLSPAYMGMINDIHMMDEMQQAVADGVDAVIVGPHWDPGLWLARQLLPIPVIGPGESALMLAAATGTRFAVITVSDAYIPHLETAIARYGFAAHAIDRPVRSFGMSYRNLVAALDGEDDEFLREFDSSAQAAISDGANVIIAGGQLFGPVFQQWDRWWVGDTGVPIIDVGAAAIKMAETMIAMRRTTRLAPSQHASSPFRRAGEEETRAARASL